MRVVSTAWISGLFDQFEQQSCLSTHRALGLASAEVPFDIYILTGIDKIPDAFRSQMAEGHIFFHDASDLSERISNDYKFVQKKYGVNDYEFLCFIRWLVIKELLYPTPFLHIDLDLFFTKKFTEIVAIFQGKTGTFGSPCLTCVSDYDWLHSYSNVFREYAADRDSLQSRLAYNGNEFRKDISSDQDLISEMERVGELPYQTLEYLQKEYCAFINPLWPYQGREKNLSYSSNEGRDCFNNQEILFWHLQNNFSEYLSRFAVLQLYKDLWPGSFLPVKLGLPFLQLNPGAENFAFFALNDCARQAAHDTALLDKFGILRCFMRSWISEWFVAQRNGREIFSEAYWWEEGVFHGS